MEELGVVKMQGVQTKQGKQHHCYSYIVILYIPAILRMNLIIYNDADTPKENEEDLGKVWSVVIISYEAQLET